MVIGWQDKGREARARQMQVYVLLQLPKEDPMDIVEVAKLAVAALEDRLRASKRLP